MEVPGEWWAVGDAGREGTAVVVGAGDTGKTTFTRWYVNELARRRGPVARVDADVGQNALGPPATMTLAMVPGGGGDERPAASFFVGDTSPVGHMLPIVVGVARLVARGYQLGARAAVIDTDGLVSAAAGGVALKQWMVELVAPRQVIALARGRELAAITAPLARDPRLSLAELPPSPRARARSAEERGRARRARLRRALAGLGRHTLSLDDIPVYGLGAAEIGALVGLVGRDGFSTGLGVVSDRSRGHIAVAAPAAAIDAAIAARVGSLRVDRELGGNG